MPPTVPPPRLHILAARTEPVAVILRRGPTDRCHILRYRTDTDEIESGSWFHGRIYKFRCDLSDDGRYMVYFAMGEKALTWNGVCEPPSLNCLMRWENSDAWFGGGVWGANNLLFVNGYIQDAKGAERPFLPGEFRFTGKLDLHFRRNDCTVDNPNGNPWGEDEGVLYPRLRRDGWIRQGPFGQDVELDGNKYQVRHDGDAGWLLKRSTDLPEIRLFFRGYFAGEGRRFEFQMPDHPAVLTPEVEWATWDCAENLLVARRGRIERWTPADFARGAPSFAADLSMLVPPGKDDDSEDEPRGG